MRDYSEFKWVLIINEIEPDSYRVDEKYLL